jgi:4-amino-4-deoxy-L-arabinose transferase-like glycosyltransferase
MTPSRPRVLQLRLAASGSVVVLLAGAVIVGAQLLSFASLTTYPPLFVDESWNANAVWTWLTTGVNFDAIHTGTLDQFGHEWVRRPFLGELPWLGTFAMLGLGVFQARLVPWFFGVLLLIVTYVAGRLSYDRQSGMAGALFLALSHPFLYSSHIARQDIILASLVVTSYALVVVAVQRKSRPAAFCAGLLIGLSLDVHQNASLFVVGMGFAYLTCFGTTAVRQPIVWFSALGGLVGTSYYLALHVLPSPSAYAAIHSFNAARWNQPAIAHLDAGKIGLSLRHAVGMFHFSKNWVELALIGFGLAYLVARWRPPDRLLAGFAGGGLLGFVLLTGVNWKPDHYAILLLPLLGLMAARASAFVMDLRQARAPVRVLAGLALAAMLAIMALRNTRPLLAATSDDYYAVSSQLRRVIPGGSRTMASPLWWLGLHDVDYRSSLNLTYHEFYNHLSIREGLASDRPDILVVDEFLRFQLSGENGVDLYPGADRELLDFLKANGTLDLEIDTAGYGHLAVYHLDWSRSGRDTEGAGVVDALEDPSNPH